MKKSTYLKVAMIPAVLALSGCAATQMAIEHRNLAAQTKMSNTIFLTPVPPSEQTVYVQLKNTSDQSLDTAALTQELDADLANQGYRVVPYNQAHYLLQVNVLSIGKTTESAAQKSLADGYGGALAGALAGGVIGNSYEGAGVGGLVGGGIGFLADSLVHTNYYAMVTDVQVGVRTKHAVATSTNANLQQGTSTHTTQSTYQQGHWLYYRTRIVSTANQVGLSFQKAEPVLAAQLVHTLAGIL